MIAVAAAAALGGCAGGDDDEDASRSAERFYAAVSASDGKAACAQLGQSTRQALEREERSPCAKAVLALELSGSEAESATV